MRLSRMLLISLILLLLLACGNQDEPRSSRFDERLSVRTSSGLGWSLWNTRKGLRLPPFGGAENGHTYVLAFIAGTSDLFGWSSVKGASVERSLVTDLKLIAGVKNAGVRIQALVRPTGQIGDSLVLSYRTKEGVQEIEVLLDKPIDRRLGPIYRGAIGQFAFKKDFMSKRADIRVKVGTKPTAQERIIAVEREGPDSIPRVFVLP